MLSYIFRGVLIAVICLCAAIGSGDIATNLQTRFAANKEQTALEVYRETVPAVAVLWVQRDMMKGHGTAFYVGHGYWVTAAHVVNNPGWDFTINGAKAVPYLIDAAHDVAIVLAPAAPVTLRLCAERPAVGTVAISVGYPLFITGAPTLTVGTIAGDTDSVRGVALDPKKLDLLLNLSVFPGNSGGPILSSTGCVIGVLSYNIIDPSSESHQRTYTLSGAMSIAYARDLLRVTGDAY